MNKNLLQRLKKICATESETEKLSKAMGYTTPETIRIWLRQNRIPKSRESHLAAILPAMEK